MEEIERRLLRLEQEREVIDRIEQKVDRLVEVGMSVATLRGQSANNASMVEKAFERIDMLRNDLIEVRQTVHTRWALARGIGLATVFFFALIQSILAFLVTDFMGTSQIDHERIIRLQEQLEPRAERSDRGS